MWLRLTILGVVASTCTATLNTVNSDLCSCRITYVTRTIRNKQTLFPYPTFRGWSFQL